MNIEEDDTLLINVLLSSGGDEGFFRVSRIIEKQLSITFNDKIGAIDAYYWSLYFGDMEMTLHYHNMVGDTELFVEKSNEGARLKLVELSSLILSFM